MSDKGWEQEIRSIEDEARDAFLAADLPVLERSWAEGFVVNSPLNAVLPKGKVLELLKAGRIRHTAYTFEIEHVSRHGDVVVVMGKDRTVASRTSGGAWTAGGSRSPGTRTSSLGRRRDASPARVRGDLTAPDAGTATRRERSR